jgi:hypothetical protein
VSVKPTGLKAIGVLSISDWYSAPNSVYVGNKAVFTLKDKSTKFEIPKSKWANPFRVNKHSPTLSNVNILYSDYIYNSDGLDIEELIGRDIGCTCPMTNTECHAQVLVDMINSRDDHRLKDLNSLIRDMSIDDKVQNEVVKKPVKEVVKKPVKEVVKKPVKEVVKKPVKEVVKKPVKEVVQKDVVKKPVKEVVQKEVVQKEVVQKDVVKKPVEEKVQKDVVNKEVVKKPVKVVVKSEVVKKPVKVVVKSEVVKKPVKVVVKKEVVKKPVKEKKEVAKKPVKEVAKKPVKEKKEVAKKPVKEVAKKPVKEKKEVAKKPVKEKKEVAKKPVKEKKEVAKKPVKEVAKKPVKEVAKKPVKEVAKKPVEEKVQKEVKKPVEVKVTGDQKEKTFIFTEFIGSTKMDIKITGVHHIVMNQLYRLFPGADPLDLKKESLLVTKSLPQKIYNEVYQTKKNVINIKACEKTVKLRVALEQCITRLSGSGIEGTPLDLLVEGSTIIAGYRGLKYNS